MSLHKTYTDTERAALRLHGLNAQGPSQLSDAFVLGMRHAGAERREQIKAACAEVFGWDDKPTDGGQQPTPLPDGTFLWDGRTPFSPSMVPAGVTEKENGRG